MGQPYKNNEIREAIKRLLNLEMYTDKVPAEIEDRLQLVLDVSPFKNKISNINVSGAATNSTSTTLLTTATDKDTYVTAVSLSIIKDVTATSVFSGINVVINGAVIYLTRIPGITLTVQQDSMSVSFPYPIKLDRGTGITLANSTNVANVSSYATVSGFTIDDRTYDMGIGAQQK